jgi:hypothetical protein
VFYCVKTLRLLIGNFCSGEWKPGWSDVTGFFFLSPFKYHSSTIKVTTTCKSILVHQANCLLSVVRVTKGSSLGKQTNCEPFVPFIYCLKLYLRDSNAAFISRSAAMYQLRA